MTKDEAKRRLRETWLSDVIENCNLIAEEHGFWDSENQGEKIALMHSELSEALESIRHGHPSDVHCPDFTNTVVELADCVIRIFDFCEHFNMPIGAAILAKMKYNESRPYKHGKQF